jgi:hypothetical protein
MDRKTADEIFLEALGRVIGIMKATSLVDEDRQRVLDIEQEAEQKSLMGLGKVVNAGVRELLQCDWMYVALTGMDFDWGSRPNLVMKKGDVVVGEEVSDEETIRRLTDQKDVWFMHKNFVVYKDKVSFPQDVMQKICHFEIPCHPADWCIVENEAVTCHSVLYAFPSTPCDVFLKEKYFGGLDERGSGTVLIGVRLR